MQSPASWTAIKLLQIPAWLITGLFVWQQQPINAFIVIALNGLGSLALALVGGIAQDVADILRKEWAPAIAGWLSRAPSKLWAQGQRMSDPVDKRYYEWWQSERMKISTYGLRDITQAPKVQDVFVDLKLVRGQATNKLVTERLENATTVWAFIRESIHAVKEKRLADNNVWVLLGAAGYGKTTLMQHVAIELIRSNHRQYKMPARIPVLLYLREYSKVFEQESIPSLGDLLYATFTRTSVKPHAQWFEDQLKQGKCVVLLDGLDEIANTKQREHVAQWIDKQIET